MRVTSLVLSVSSLFCLEALGSSYAESPPNQKPLNPESDPLLGAPLQLNLTVGPVSRGQFSGQGNEQLDVGQDGLFASIKIIGPDVNNPGPELKFLVDTGSDLTWVAEENYQPLGGAAVVPQGSEIPAQATFPTAKVPTGDAIDNTIWTAWYSQYGASGRTSA
jgi:hypothetical protein